MTDFTLANESPATRKQPITARPARQLKLLSGLDCLPGQQDLIPDLDCPAGPYLPTIAELRACPAEWAQRSAVIAQATVDAINSDRAPDWSAEPLSPEEEAALADMGYERQKGCE